MSAFTNSGRSDREKFRELTGSLRPKAVIERDATETNPVSVPIRLYVQYCNLSPDIY